MLRFCSLTVAVLVCSLLLSAGPLHAQTEAGMKVYAAQKCSICHSIAGQGNKKFPLDTVGAKLTADQIREWIVAPVEAAKKANSTAKPAMRAYPSLSKEDVEALVAYLKTLGAK